MSKEEDNLSRVYTVNLGKAWLTPRYRRTDRVVNMVREFAIKNMQSDEIKIDQDLNRHIWNRGKTNPPRKVRVKMVKDEDDVVTVTLYEEATELAEAEEKEEEEEQEEEEEETKVRKSADTQKKGDKDENEDET
jgi:large subunit ribosomal protein L31e